MARRSIDAALLAAASAVRDEPGGCRIGVDAPYEASKALLLLQEVTEANRCRVVWSRQLGFATVIGFNGDRQAVELEHTSLLEQVITGLVRTGSRRTLLGRSRTPLVAPVLSVSGSRCASGSGCGLSRATRPET